MLRAANGRPLASALSRSVLRAPSSITNQSASRPGVLGQYQPCQILSIRSYRDASGPFSGREGRSGSRTPQGGRAPHGVRGPPRGSSSRSGVFKEFAASEEILEGTSEKQQEYITRFEDLATTGKVHETLINTLTRRMQLENMTPVQSQTINETLEGVDMIAQARTGTGKTLAFLIPIIQNILAKDPHLERPVRARVQGPDVRALIISPTRELAEQIAAEATKVAAATGIKVQAAVGGTQKRLGLYKIVTQGCHILVGTPGRLFDILSDRSTGIKLDNLTSFVLDEADRLLDDGFLPDIQQLEELLPAKEKRQNLLFSATVPREVLNLSRTLLNTNARFVQTIQPGEAQTHQKIPQKVVKLESLANTFPALLELVKREVHNASRERPFKAMVFANTTAETVLYADVFANLKYESPDGISERLNRKCMVLQIHSKLSQPQRTRAAEQFKRAKSAILFTSDVSARGMDYPDVTHVIQMGMPKTREFYIHRLGRTGRAGKEGEGWLFTDKMEEYDLARRLKQLPLEQDTTLQSASANLKDENSLTEEVRELLSATRRSAEQSPTELKADVYQAAFGFLGHIPNKQNLVDELNARAQVGWGMPEPPPMNPVRAQKLGLSRVHGLNLAGGGHSNFGQRSLGRGGYGGGRSGGRDELIQSGSLHSALGSDSRGGSYDSRSGGGGYDAGSGGYNRNRGFGGRGARNSNFA